MQERGSGKILPPGPHQPSIGLPADTLATPGMFVCFAKMRQINVAQMIVHFGYYSTCLETSLLRTTVVDLLVREAVQGTANATHNEDLKHFERKWAALKAETGTLQRKYGRASLRPKTIKITSELHY